MDDILWLNWTIMAISFAVLIWLGWRSSTIAEGDDESGFLIAGRSLGPFVGASTIVATGFSGWGFMGSPGVAYEFGATELLGNFMFAPAMVIAVLFFARYLARRAQKMRSCTIPEYAARLHGDGSLSRWVQGVAAVITIVLLLVFLTSQIKAVGILAAGWLDFPEEWGATLMISIIILYTVLGGLTAVAWTDTLMLMGMLLGAVIIATQIFGDLSPFALVEQLRAIDPALVDPATARPYGEAKGSVFLVLPYAFLFAAVLPFMAVRFLAFRPDVKFHHAGMFVAPFACILSIIPVVGLYMRVKMPGLEHADQAMPIYLETFLHPASGGFITLCILFAMKSTANSLLHTVASAASHDLRVAIFPGHHDPRLTLNINRLAVVVFGVTGLLMMLFAPPFLLSFLGILGTGTLLATLVGPVFVSSIWRGNAWGALAAMLGGFVTSGGMLLFTDAGWVEGPLMGCVISTLLYVGVSMATFGLTPRVGVTA
ncbi:sodium:solute symporter family protein [Jannaschia rubra]|uniref:Pantothenate permease n=1 Tax=Jannaschia rubra TaxID=282197 RepID=A0A0M6XNU1_9RHOB|nr:sodium:solute symporter family protein [Jannaschia rubra]CTQ32840.1 Pantothenate permease [Jannaschia rubra]SFG81613.1 sodium/pantothenate symporter [Jannaschia rubra]